MEDNSSSKWPWWLIVTMIGGMGIYLGMIFLTGGFRANLISMVFDLLLFFILLQLWLVFFSQFILPVQTFQERRKIFDRLLSYLGGTRGPAIFVRDGELVANPDELHRRGPGVIWLDTASGAVTRAGASFKNVFGPGVNFTDGNEYITKEDVVDLHIQVQRIGPGEEEDPFKADEKDSAEVKAIRDRSLKVSGLTRDGIEIIPSLEVVFKLNTGVVKKGERGSLFGYSQDRQREDNKAIEKAIIGQAVNPNQPSDTNYYQMAWNELPGYLAADLWREFLSKFRLDQLFNAEFNMPHLDPPTPNSNVPPSDVTALSNPVQAGAQGFVEDTLTGMLHGMNRMLKGYTRNGGQDGPAQAEGSENEDERQADKITGLQMINQMVRQRLMYPTVRFLDNEGVLMPGTRQGEECGLLKERGIRVLDVTISNLRVLPPIDAHLVANWTANWLTNARAETGQITIRRNLAAIQAEEEALRKYAVALSQHLISRKAKAVNLSETARILLTRSRQTLIRNHRAEPVVNEARETLEEIVQWLEMESE